MAKTSSDGETSIVPCECKIKQDREFLYKQILADSGISIHSYLYLNFENKESWIKPVLFDSQVFDFSKLEKYYQTYLSMSNTKLVAFQHFFEWYLKYNPAERVSNFLIDNSQVPSLDPKYRYIINFLAMISVKRLIPVKMLDYTQFKTLVMEKKFDFESTFSDYKIVFLTFFWDATMLKDMQYPIVYEAISKNIDKLLRKENMMLITTLYGPISKIRRSEGNDLLKDENVLRRCNDLLNLVLNNSKTSMIRIKTSKSEKEIQEEMLNA